MKIAIIAGPYISVPPIEYGGAERRINALGKGLVEKGLDITLFASGDSKTSIPLKPICNVALSSDPGYNHQKDRLKRINEINNTTSKLIDNNYDLINIHDYENLDLINRLAERPTPLLVSVRHSLNPVAKEVYNIFKDHPNVDFHGVSENQTKFLDLDIPFIYNGDNPSFYEAVDDIKDKRDYFFSIGNIRSSKGHTVAINLAKKIGMDLVISAGSLYYPAEEAYFENMIKPRVDERVYEDKKGFLKSLSDGTYKFGQGKIINFGPSNDLEKKVLFKHASFTQFLGNLEQYNNADACPGVIIESLLSGTPILGVKGSISEEMVKERVGGINVSSINEAELRLSEILTLNPKDIRNFAVESYSNEIMADKYIDIYKKIINSKKEVLVG